MESVSAHSKRAKRCKTQMQNEMANTYVVKFVVKTTCIANGLAVVVTAPKCRCGGFAVGARGSRSSGRGLLLLHVRM